MLMFDSVSSTLWSQLIGEGVVGSLLETQLLRYPAQLVSFAGFRCAFPDTLRGLLVNNHEGCERAVSFLEAGGVGLEPLVDATRAERAAFAERGAELGRHAGRAAPPPRPGAGYKRVVGVDGIIRGVWVGLVTPDTAAELLAEVGVVWAP